MTKKSKLLLSGLSESREWGYATPFSTLTCEFWEDESLEDPGCFFLICVNTISTMYQNLKTKVSKLLSRSSTERSRPIILIGDVWENQNRQFDSGDPGLHILNSPDYKTKKSKRAWRKNQNSCQAAQVRVENGVTQPHSQLSLASFEKTDHWGTLLLFFSYV